VIVSMLPPALIALFTATNQIFYITVCVRSHVDGLQISLQTLQTCFVCRVLERLTDGSYCNIGATLYVTMVSPPLLLKVVVTVTTTFSVYFGRENRIFLLSEAFCGLKYTENAIAAGAPQRSPRPSSRLGSGHPFHYLTPLGAFGASMLARLDHRAPDTKSWRRHWSPPLFKVKLRQRTVVSARSCFATYRFP